MKKLIISISIILVTVATTTSCAPLTPDQRERLFLASSTLMSIGNTLQQQEAINRYNQRCDQLLNQQQDFQLNYNQQQSQMNHYLQLMMLNQNR